MFEPRVTASRGFNLKQKVVVILMDLFLLGELTFCIYLGKQNPEDMVGAFLKTFIPMVIGTLVLGRIFIKVFRSEEPDLAVVLE
ncbi:MAG: hypothetical protein V1689_06920 [Pseudomonadota bacterium]